MNKMTYYVNTFWLNSQILKTKNSIILALPKNFDNQKKYSIYLVFDGKDLINNSKNNIITKNESNKIFIGLSSLNNATRFNDFSSYQNKDVKALMIKYFPNLKTQTNNYLGGNGKNYSKFISTELMDWITKTQKIKIKDLNLLGCSMGAYFSLQQLYLSDLKFKKLYLFSPSIWFNQNILNDLETKSLNQNATTTINLWVGLKEPHFFEKTIPINYYQDALTIEKILSNKKNIIVKLFVDKNGSHGFKWWINFINNHQDLW